MTSANVKPTDHDEDAISKDGPRFEPPLYIQRYQFIYDLLFKENPPVTRMADFGCAEGRFLRRLKKLPFLEELSAVDISRQALEECEYEARPLAWDFLFGRSVKMNLTLYQGSVAEPDARMVDLDAISCVELVEHLTDTALEKFPHAVFGVLKPRTAVITTPNSEYNVVFPQLKVGEFRHWDHKFEWTREEFRRWCDAIVRDFPDYTYETSGVGDPPSAFSHVGHCSQIAIFRRQVTKEKVDVSLRTCSPSTCYAFVNSFTYPKREKHMEEPPFVQVDWGTCTDD